ncbi:hypothetical protein C1752_01695 [Acaryochloris thomasi RCC1774]|uniref:Uncharacterized protein n=1 Tax=Acaryochloris thomasi RCC1774 TaxID=1764569 RepID=A0A2W1K1F6_9CYAN|nr:hypothetical protein [Acaryochloris thomasi]PZD73997.1 hypothetical protein C1752_01695 [Acaryochloris thomasi RCC1774]
MSFPYRLSSIAAVMAMCFAAPAGAAPLQKRPSHTSNLPKSGLLIASPFRKEISPAHQRRKQLMEMLVMQMEVADMASESLTSDDPDIKQLAQEMLDESNKISAKILDMLDPRNPPFRNDR